MNKTILFFFSIFLIQLVSADLLLTPNPISIDVKQGELTSFNLSLTNTHPFRIKSFKFKNLSEFTFPDIVLEPNETQIIEFTVKINTFLSETRNSDVSFKYLVDIPTTPQIYEINMTETGFNPDFIVIHEGDTIIWRNKDDLPHTVTGSNFDYELPINGSVSHLFNQKETYDYQDLILFWGGTIEVLNKSEAQEVSNPSHNKLFITNIQVISEPTNISMNIVA